MSVSAMIGWLTFKLSLLWLLEVLLLLLYVIYCQKCCITIWTTLQYLVYHQTSNIWKEKWYMCFYIHKCTPHLHTKWAHSCTHFTHYKPTPTPIPTHTYSTDTCSQTNMPKRWTHLPCTMLVCYMCTCMYI